MLYSWIHVILNMIPFLNFIHDSVSRGASSSNSPIPTTLWSCVSNLNVAPKIKHFMWRTLSNAISTKENLFRRKISQSPMCPICDSAPKDVTHLLLNRPWAAKIWFGLPLCLRTNQHIDNFGDWCFDTFLSQPFPKCDKISSMSLVAYTGWFI